MDKELMEQIAKVLYKYNAITKPNWEEATDEWKSYARGQTKAILPIIEAHVKAAKALVMERYYAGFMNLHMEVDRPRGGE